MLERIGRNVLANWTGLAVTMLIAFFMSPYLVHELGDAQYGVWVLIVAVTGYLGLMDGGLKVSIVKFVAAHHAVGEDVELSETVSTALALYGCIALLILVCALALGPVLDVLFRIPSTLLPTARSVLAIAGTTLAVTLMSSVFNGFLAGMQRYDLVNLVGISVSLAAATAIFVVVSRGHGIVGLALVQLSSHVLTGISMMIVAKRLRPDLRIGPRWVRLERARRLYGYSVYVVLTSLAMLLLFRSGEIVTGVLLGTASVTYFAIGGMLVEYLAKIVGSMTQVLHPLASAKAATGDQAGLKVALILSTRACVAIALPACAGFAIVGAPFIAAWMGPEYAAISAPVLTTLAAGRLFWLAQSGAGNILLGANRHQQVTIVFAGTGVAGLVLAIVLARPLGLLGIASGLSLSIFIWMGLGFTVYVCRSTGIRASEYLRGAWLGPVLATAPFAASLLALVHYLQPDTILEIGLVLAMTAPIYLACAYHTCVSGDERAMIRALWEKSRA